VNISVSKLSKQTRAKRTRVVVYGGNGYVGTRVAKNLAESNAHAICLSRTGHKPVHLRNEEWSNQVCWSKGDASTPDKKFLASADSLVCLVGSAPTPTFSKAAFEQKVFSNGITNATAIKAAGEAGVKKIVLLGAQIQGKELALNAAKEFAQLSDEHSAIVFQPGMIYGRRYLASGKSIPLNVLVGPMPFLLSKQFVSVEKLATRIVEVTLSDGPHTGEFTIIKNADI